MNRLYALALASVAGCHAMAEPKSSVPCGPTETVLDGVCVSKKIADYVSCVRAQGATLGEDRSKKLSADAAYAGAHTGILSDAQESLARKYSVSDQAVLSIIETCNRLASNDEKAGSVPDKPKTWRPPRAGEKSFTDLAEALGKFGTIIAKSELSAGSPSVTTSGENENGFRASTHGDHYLFVKDADDNKVWWLRCDVPPPRHFLWYFEAELRESSAIGAASVRWITPDRAGGTLGLWHDGRIDVVEWFPSAKTWTSKTATFPRGKRVSVLVKRAMGRLDVWVDGERALEDIEVSSLPIDQLDLGAWNTAIVAYRNFILVRLE